MQQAARYLLLAIAIVYAFRFVNGVPWRYFSLLTVVECVLVTCFLLITFPVLNYATIAYEANFTKLGRLRLLVGYGGVVLLNIALVTLVFLVPFLLLVLEKNEWQELFTNLQLGTGIRQVYLVSSILTLLIFHYLKDKKTSEKLLQLTVTAAEFDKQQLRTHYQWLEDQLNPHFLFNNLNVLSSLLYSNPSEARRFLNQLAVVYRSILEVREKQLITLREEMHILNAYTYLLSIRFEAALRFSIRAGADEEELLIPPLVLQMLTENAVKHNIVTSRMPLLIEIHTIAGQRRISVINTLQPRPDVRESTGKGIHNIRSRYQYFTDRAVEITQTAGFHNVSVPLLDVYESRNH